MGIGTVIGLWELPRNTEKLYVFSSGFGYGYVPKFDERWEIICVRGPLTAQALGIDEKLAITDAGVLSDVLIEHSIEKKYKCSYIPHHYSEEKYGHWPELCAERGIHFISPIITNTNSVLDVIHEIARSEVIICEALHGAIIADTLRVPWIPVKAYSHINSFKWQDYCSSVQLELHMEKIPAIYSDTFLKNKLISKTPFTLPPAIEEFVYKAGQRALNNKKQKVMDYLEKIKVKNESFLCEESVLALRKEQLYEKLQLIRK